MAIHAKGEGCIAKRDNGRWQGSLQVGGIRKTVYGKTRADVVAKLKALQAEADKNHRLSDTGRLSLGDYLKLWQEQRETRPTTKARDDYTLKHLAPLNDVRLTQLTPLRLARFLTELRKSASPRTAIGTYRLLHKALGDAVRWGLLASNPLDNVDAPRYRPGERCLWTPEQVSLFISALQNAQGGHYGGLFLFLLASGCRIGEALGLRWSDVDWAKGTVRIERQLTEAGGKHIELAPKTKAGVRTITLPSFGLEALKRQRLWASAVRVFTTQVGTVPLRGNIRRALYTVCKNLGLPVIRIHDLRHLHLSLLAMNGVPVKVAQERAGHSSPQITMQVYTHVLGDGDRLAAEALNRIVSLG